MIGNGKRKNMKAVIKFIKSVFFNAAFILAPALTSIMILKSDKPIDYIVDRLEIKLNPYFFVYIFPLLLIAVTAISFYFMIKYTANHLIRFVAIILSASISFYFVILLGPKDACNGPVTILFLLILGFVYFICLSITLVLYCFKDSKPANRDITAESPAPTHNRRKLVMIIFRNKVNILVNAGYIFIPPLACFKIIKSVEHISNAGEMFLIALLLIAVMTILSYVLIEFTTNKSVRIIVIILSAMWSIYTVVNSTPNDGCVSPVIFTYFLPPLCLVYFLCFSVSFIFIFLKRPGRRSMRKQRNEQ